MPFNFKVNTWFLVLVSARLQRINSIQCNVLLHDKNKFLCVWVCGCVLQRAVHLHSRGRKKEIKKAFLLKGNTKICLCVSVVVFQYVEQNVGLDLPLLRTERQWPSPSYVPYGISFRKEYVWWQMFFKIFYPTWIVPRIPHNMHNLCQFKR